MTTNVIVKFISSKSLLYELKYLSDKFKPRKLLLIIFAIIGGIVVSLDGAQAFFTGKDSPVPQSWTFLKKPFNARGIAIAIIVAPYLAIWYSNNRDTEEEKQNISQITEKVTLPFVEEDLNKFLDSLCVKFSLSNSARIYIMMPIRIKFGQWHLQTITNTQNYDNIEKRVSLKLDEGIIGDAFQGMNYDSRLRPKYIDITNLHNLPANYKHLSQNNKDLVRRDNKGYVVVPIFDRAFLSSLFIVDTNDPNDLEPLKKEELYNEIFNWIGSEPILLTLIWRVRNNGH
jgi:hypothetical protein